MLRNLLVRNWKANYRLARRTSIISHFQSDIQGVFRFFTVTGKRRSNRQLISAVRAGADRTVPHQTNRPCPFLRRGKGQGRGLRSGTVGNRWEPCYRFRIRPMT